MKAVFPKLENGPTDGPLGSPPLSPLTPPPLIPKPPGETGRTGRAGREGYALKDVLEKQHGWEDGLYHQIRV